MNNAKTRNIQILRQIHKNTPFYIAFLLIMKEDFTLNFAFYLFSYFFRFIGIFILTGCFIIDPEKIKNTIVLSDIVRYITSYELVSLFKLTNRVYVIISLIIFGIFVLQNLLYLLKILEYKKSDTKEEMTSYKIPKCKKSAKNIPFPNNKYNKNIKTLLPIRQSSTIILKENSTNLSQKYPSENNFQMIDKKSIFSSFQRGKNRIPKFNFNKRQNSWEKSKIMKNDDSIKKIKIEQIHNYKIQYLLLKEKIKNFSSQENISLDIKNKIIQEISIKLNLILKKSNEYLEEQKPENDNIENIEENNNDIEYNKNLLNIYKEKNEKWNKRLQEIKNNNYISNLISQINEVDKGINLYEKENEELLLNNGISKNDIILPNIQRNNKIENDSILERQLQNKIIEFKDKIGQELAISKKIKDNEISIKKLDEIINNFNEKSGGFLDNDNNDIFVEENNFNIDFSNINNDIFKFNKKRKLSKLNELISVKNDHQNNNLNNTTSANKDSKNRIITSENQSNVEENIYMLPFTTKRKNLSCSNIPISGNETVNNNKKIKEIILQNLDLKEKEEKSLINAPENGEISLKKYKHIKLKPNFSFTNDYHKFKDDNINKFKKLQSSAEITNLKNNDNNNLNNKEDLIKESIVDDSSNKIENIQNIASIEKNSKFNRKKRMKDLYNENNKVNNDINEIKKERFSTTTEQREKVLNTIMYDDL